MPQTMVLSIKIIQRDWTALTSPECCTCCLPLLTLPAVNPPGTFYVAPVNGGQPSATRCPVNTYGPGFKKQRACVPCPSGYTTDKDVNNVITAQSRQDKKSACGESDLCFVYMREVCMGYCQLKLQINAWVMRGRCLADAFPQPGRANLWQHGQATQ